MRFISPVVGNNLINCLEQGPTPWGRTMYKSITAQKPVSQSTYDKILYNLSTYDKILYNLNLDITYWFQKTLDAEHNTVMFNYYQKRYLAAKDLKDRIEDYKKLLWS